MPDQTEMGEKKSLQAYTHTHTHTHRHIVDSDKRFLAHRNHLDSSAEAKWGGGSSGGKIAIEVAHSSFGFALQNWTQEDNVGRTSSFSGGRSRKKIKGDATVWQKRRAKKLRLGRETRETIGVGRHGAKSSTTPHGWAYSLRVDKREYIQ